MTEHPFTQLLNALNHPGPVAVCAYQPKRGNTFGPIFLGTPGDAAGIAAALPDVDMWFGVNPVPPGLPSGRRGTAEQVTHLLAVWADLDVKPGGMPTWQAAHGVVADLADLLGTSPTAVVNSGHGLQPYWALTEAVPLGNGNRPPMQSLVRRFHLMVATVAERHGGLVDTVSDLSRVLRVPGTTNRKADPVPVALDSCTGTVLDLATLRDTLDALDIPDVPEDTTDLGEQVAPRAGWAHAQRTCPYTRGMIEGWAHDQPTARHPWLVSQATRLALAHREGCLTEDTHRDALVALAHRFTALCARPGDTRTVKPGEVSDAVSWGVRRAETTPDPWADPGPGKARPLGERHRHVVKAWEATLPAGPAGEAVAALQAHLATYLDDDDPEPTLFALAVAVVAEDPGPEPLWGMLVGPPSGGKTERSRMLSDTADEAVDELTHAGLLSWTKQKDPKPCGILARLPEGSAFLTIGDFSTVLATSDRGGRDQLFADLRRVYDGSLRRDVGNAPRPLTWSGRLGILSAVTPTIDDYSAHSDALGPRWLYCRLRERPAVDRLRIARARRGDLTAKRAEAARLARVAVLAGRKALPEVVLSDDLLALLGDAATVGAYARGSVPRDGYGRREIIGVPVVEEPHRLVSQLHALTRGLLALSLDEGAAGRLAVRCALDTVPQARRAALEALARLGAAHIAAVADEARLDRKVTRRALDDLRALRLAVCPVEDASGLDDPERDLPRNTPRPWHLGGDLDPITVATVVTTADVPKKGDSPPDPPGKEGSEGTPSARHGGTTHVSEHRTPPVGGIGDLIGESLTAGALNLTPDPPPDTTEPFRPTILMERVREALRGAPEPLSVRGILDRVTGKDADIRKAIACLVDDREVVTEPGLRGSVLHRLVDP